MENYSSLYYMYFLAQITYYGVVVALQTNIWFVNTSTVAVFVAATLR